MSRNTNAFWSLIALALLFESLFIIMMTCGCHPNPASNFAAKNFAFLFALIYALAIVFVIAFLAVGKRFGTEANKQHHQYFDSERIRRHREKCDKKNLEEFEKIWRNNDENIV
jgi:hypothetical protein